MPFYHLSPKYLVLSTKKTKGIKDFYYFVLYLLKSKKKSKFHIYCDTRAKMDRQNYLLESKGGIK